MKKRVKQTIQWKRKMVLKFSKRALKIYIIKLKSWIVKNVLSIKLEKSTKNNSIIFICARNYVLAILDEDI